MWTVIMFFNRTTITRSNLTEEEAKSIVDVTVFNNNDCIQCVIFRQ